LYLRCTVRVMIKDVTGSDPFDSVWSLLSSRDRAVAVEMWNTRSGGVQCPIVSVFLYLRSRPSVHVYLIYDMHSSHVSSDLLPHL
jgi:hypothetical protein